MSLPAPPIRMSSPDAAAQHVVAVAAVERVVAGQADQHVVAVVAAQRVVSGRAGDRLVERAKPVRVRSPMKPSKLNAVNPPV